MEMNGQLHALSALSLVTTEHGGCVSLRTDLNTLGEGGNLAPAWNRTTIPRL